MEIGEQDKSGGPTPSNEVFSSVENYQVGKWPSEEQQEQKRRTMEKAELANEFERDIENRVI
eukprot:8919640-Karenia_brevis.AAC.1